VSVLRWVEEVGHEGVPGTVMRISCLLESDVTDGTSTAVVVAMVAGAPPLAQQVFGRPLAG
jgi:hypothetical protein